MLPRKLRNSLNARIFLATFGLLLLAAVTTFGLLAWATPFGYASAVSDDTEAQARELVARLDGCAYGDAGDIIGDFLRHNDVDLVLTAPDGSVDRRDVGLSALSWRDDTVTTVYTAVADGQGEVAPAEGGDGDADGVDVRDADDGDLAEEDAVQGTTGGDGIDVNIAVSSWVQSVSQAVSFRDREGTYALTVTPSLRIVNQAVQALVRVAPWLLAAMLLFSALCALLYARFVTRPIVRLSGLSERMARLDFRWGAASRREDEIGILERNLDALSRRLSEALYELRGANEALQDDIERDRERERQRLAFFSAVSHELKTPLTILKGQIAGMLDGIDVYRDRDAYLARALRVTGRMEALVQEILAVTRVEVAAERRAEAVNLAALLRERLATHADWIEMNGNALHVRLPERATVLGDAGLLAKALDNVLSNAIRYSPPGADVSVALRREGADVVLAIENGGASIPQEAFPHLFEAFYRVEGSRNRSTGGSGLGLYLVKLILDRQGASYRMENAADGVRFLARFAAAPDADADAADREDRRGADRA